MLEGTRAPSEHKRLGTLALTLALGNGPIARVTGLAGVGMLSEANWALLSRRQAAREGSNGGQRLGHALADARGRRVQKLAGADGRRPEADGRQTDRHDRQAGRQAGGHER